MLQYKSINDLARVVRNNIFRIPPDVDLIVGVPRSGLLVASLLSLYTNAAMTDLDGLFENRLLGVGASKRMKSTKAPFECKRILIVEDSVCFGNSINRAKSRLDNSVFRRKYLTLAAYVTPGYETLVDIALEVVPLPRCFEWNIFHHQGLLGQMCWDMDGVLCRDPTPQENDDGSRYLEFLKTTPPNIIPTSKIGTIVTSRLEKYRKETEEWLEAHGVSYDALVMLDSTAEERASKGLHAPFKTEVYKSRPEMVLFVESNPVQAEAIMKAAHKPVYCTENGVFYSDHLVTKAEDKLNKRRRLINALVRFKNKHPLLKRMHAWLKIKKH